MSTEVLKPVIVVVLLAVAAFVILRPAFGTAPATGPATRRRIFAPRSASRVSASVSTTVSSARARGPSWSWPHRTPHLDLVTASATAKNVTATYQRGRPRHLRLAGRRAVAAGRPDGRLQPRRRHVRRAHTLKKGSGFVRVVLLTVVFALVANLAYEQWVA